MSQLSFNNQSANKNIMNQENLRDEFKPAAIENHAERLVSKLEEITASISNLKATNINLQRLHDQSLIHHLQLQEDIESMKFIYRRLRSQLEQQSEPLKEEPAVYPHDQNDETFDVTPIHYEVNPAECASCVNMKFGIQTHSVVCSICFNSTGDKIAFSNNKTIFLVSTVDGSIISTYHIDLPQDSQDYNVRTIKISPDDQYIAIGGPNNNILIYSLESTQLVADLEEHTNKVSSLLFSNDGKTLYSGGFDGTICVWNLETMSLTTKQSHGNSEPSKNNQDNMIVSLTKDDEESFIAVGFMDGYVGLYAPDLQSSPNRFPAHDQYLLDVATSPLDCTIATSSHDCTTKIWVLRGVASCRGTLVGHTDLVLSTAFSPFETICFTGSKDETIKVWNHKSLNLLFTIAMKENTIFEIAHHPTEKMFASCSGSGSVAVWTYNI